MSKGVTALACQLPGEWWRDTLYECTLNARNGCGVDRLSAANDIVQEAHIESSCKGAHGGVDAYSPTNNIHNGHCPE